MTNKKETALHHLRHYTEQWELKPDGEVFYTHCSVLQPVWYKGEKAMIKAAWEEDERWGWSLLKWWNGNGAAKVLQYNENAYLMERITGTMPTLKTMVAAGEDKAAAGILCGVAAKIHSGYSDTIPHLIPLQQYFKELWPGRDKYGSIVSEGAAIAGRLLNSQQDITVLHGDLHHENVLHDTQRGWLAIDPKRVYGDRAFDYTNIFCNPDQETALKPGRFDEQFGVILQASGLERTRLLEWIIAYTVLSAVWILDDGDDASLDLGIAALAMARL